MKVKLSNSKYYMHEKGKIEYVFNVGDMVLVNLKPAYDNEVQGTIIAEHQQHKNAFCVKFKDDDVSKNPYLFNDNTRWIFSNNMRLDVLEELCNQIAVAMQCPKKPLSFHDVVSSYLDIKPFNFNYSFAIEKMSYIGEGRVKIQSIKNFPLKVVFDMSSDKTTLLFKSESKNRKYDSYSCLKDKKDLYNPLLGFCIAYYKYIHRKEKPELVRALIEKRFVTEITVDRFSSVLLDYLVSKEVGLSLKQVDKLFNKILDKDTVNIDFNKNDVEKHILEIEFKNFRKSTPTKGEQ